MTNKLRDADGGWTGRTVQASRLGVSIYCKVLEQSETLRKQAGTYGFAVVTDDAADRVTGVPDVEGTPIIYVGSNVGKHYWDSKATDSVPADLIRYLHNSGYQLVEGVDGGWIRWEGRPEWSDTYMDAEGWTAVSLADRSD